MQIDFHHGVVYVLARLAGFKHLESATIAYASQYVDDATNRGTIVFQDNHRYAHIASAHEIFDLDNNCNDNENCQVWVPFHFLPGNNGAPAGQALELPLNQRLLVTPDSPVANDLWKACLAARGKPNSLHRLGITTHTYADTWAHRRFAGIRNRINKASNIKHNRKEVWEIVGVIVSETMMLGHSAVLEHPDLPFLQWTYEASDGTRVQRDNPNEFTVAARRIFEWFSYFRDVMNPKMMAADEEILRSSLRDFDDVDGNVRHERWMELLKQGKFSFGALTGEQMDDLRYAAKGQGSWKYKALGTEKGMDDPKERFVYGPEFEKSDWKKFHDALTVQQWVVVNRILPKYQLPMTDELIQAAA